ncbi:MAG: hypothetical protein JNK99_00665 [Candidatus Accumulibacter sp.]|uniref:hypothetical protein n=1 Tax=Accumulibacter sp. TaxID=2053492 RepID=UPI001A599D30|nr:hypothetical protein [Accumulibacter sp.]MBL8393250.1 hypothetical protein [Accumulibacter sp.]
MPDQEKSNGPRPGSSKRRWPIKCCPDLILLPADPTGNHMRARKGGLVWAGQEFEMRLTFADSEGDGDEEGGCRCSCCEYRQYVRGTFRLNGRLQEHRLVDGRMHPTKWREDAIQRFPGGQLLRYGHRRDTYSTWDDYPPLRGSGCAYRGRDAPGVVALPGTAFEIDLYFKGEVRDVCENRIVVQRYWRVSYAGILRRP